MGNRNGDNRLRNIVKKYDFGSKVETRDPFTKQPMQKPAKPFLVESTARRFESGDIIFPEEDNALEEQLLGYIIDRVTPSGQPVYKAANEAAGDHALDALMLSIMAFVMEATPLGKPKYEIGIAFSGQFGERVDAFIHEGDTVIYGQNKKDVFKEQREKNKPQANRDQLGQDKSVIRHENQLPANNLQEPPKEPGLWAWPGFSHDAPKPATRSLGEASQNARQRLGLSPVRGSRPRRKNI